MGATNLPCESKTWSSLHSASLMFVIPTMQILATRQPGVCGQHREEVRPLASSTKVRTPQPKTFVNPGHHHTFPLPASNSLEVFSQGESPNLLGSLSPPAAGSALISWA